MIQEELVEIAGPILSDKKVQDIIVGLRYTAVLLEGDTIGLSFTLKGPFLSKEKKDIFTREPKRLANLLFSTSPIEASIGLATINAASQILASQMDFTVSKNLIDVLSLSRDDNILMVGLMMPLAWELHEHINKIWAVEDGFITREGPPNLEVRPWWAIDLILHKQKISALFISGSAVSNKSINHILELVRKEQRQNCKIALVGPSVPVFPEFWREKGIDVLAASLIRDVKLTTKVVKVGGGSRELFKKGCLKKVLIDLREI